MWHNWKPDWALRYCIVLHDDYRLPMKGKHICQCKSHVVAAENGLNRISHQAAEPSGKLNLTLPALLTRSAMIKAIAEFAKTFPKIAISISCE